MYNNTIFQYPEYPPTDWLLDPHGIFAWMSGHASALHDNGIPDAIIPQIIRTRIACCGRRVSDREILAAIRAALPYSHHAHPVVERKLPIDPPSAIQRLIGLSKMKFEEIPQDPGKIIPRGYYCDYVCIGYHLEDMVTLPQLDIDAPMDTYSVVVPAVMSYQNGIRDKRWETRSRSNFNTGKVYATVVSLPHLPLEKQVAEILNLSSNSSLALVVWTSENTIEGWFSTSSMREGWLAFCEKAIALGANPSIKIHCQPYALPAGIDQCNGRRNTIIYLDPPVLSAMHGDAACPPTQGKKRVRAENKRQRRKGKKQRRKWPRKSNFL